MIPAFPIWIRRNLKLSNRGKIHGTLRLDWYIYWLKIMNKQFFKIQRKSFNHEKFGDRKDVKDLVDLVLIVLAVFLQRLSYSNVNTIFWQRIFRLSNAI
jgi:hypothetical protein